jgi:hypothetical protein
VAGILVLGGLWMAIQWGVIDRWDNLDKEMTAAISRKQELETRLVHAKRAVEDWGAIQPLAHNEGVGAGRFREDMSNLLDAHGLGESCTIRNLPARTLKSTHFTEVRLSVTTRGTFKQVLGFLCDFYRREYPARLEQINLSAVESRRSSRSRGPGARNAPSNRRNEQPVAAGPDGPPLNITLTATALVLPEIKDVEQAAIERPEPVDEAQQGRLPRPSDEYAAVLDKNVFKLWTPTRTTPTPPDPPPIANDGPEPGPVVVREEPPPNKTLIGVTSTDGVLTAYVRDDDRLDLEPERIHINEPVWDGTLVLVYPRGMVEQVPAEERDGSFGYKYYVYDLGATFADRRELDPASEPELQRALELALAPG